MGVFTQTTSPDETTMRSIASHQEVVDMIERGAASRFKELNPNPRYMHTTIHTSSWDDGMKGYRERIDVQTRNTGTINLESRAVPWPEE